MEALEYSKRLGDIAPEQLQAALDRFSLGKLLGAEAVRQGLFGQNVFVSASEGEFVLRGCPHSFWQFPQERFFAQLIHERTSAPAPWPYLLDQADDIFGWSYAIMPRLPGIQIGDREVRRSLSEADRSGVARALGTTLAALHRLKLPAVADFDFNTLSMRADPRPFGERIEESLRDRLARCRAAAPHKPESQFEWCESVFAENRSALEVPFEATIVHHDYKAGNTVATRSESGWKVTGVFDLMECYFGDPEEDLVRTMFDYPPRAGRSDLAREFIEAYRDGGSLRMGFEERFRIYMLRDCLVLWEYGQRNGTWSLPGNLRDWAEPFVLRSPF